MHKKEVAMKEQITVYDISERTYNNILIKLSYIKEKDDSCTLIKSLFEKKKGQQTTLENFCATLLEIVKAGVVNYFTLIDNKIIVQFIECNNKISTEVYKIDDNIINKKININQQFFEFEDVINKIGMLVNQSKIYMHQEDQAKKERTLKQLLLKRKNTQV